MQYNMNDAWHRDWSGWSSLSHSICPNPIAAFSSKRPRQFFKDITGGDPCNIATDKRKGIRKDMIQMNFPKVYPRKMKLVIFQVEMIINYYYPGCYFHLHDIVIVKDADVTKQSHKKCVKLSCHHWVNLIAGKNMTEGLSENILEGVIARLEHHHHDIQWHADITPNLRSVRWHI